MVYYYVQFRRTDRDNNRWEKAAKSSVARNLADARVNLAEEVIDTINYLSSDVIYPRHTTYDPTNVDHQILRALALTAKVCQIVSVSMFDHRIKRTTHVMKDGERD